MSILLRFVGLATDAQLVLRRISDNTVVFSGSPIDGQIEYIALLEPLQVSLTSTVTIANEAATWNIVEKCEKFSIDVRNIEFQAMDTVVFNATRLECAFEIEPEEKPFGV